MKNWKKALAFLKVKFSNKIIRAFSNCWYGHPKFREIPDSLKGNTVVPGTTSSEPRLPSWSRQENRFPYFVWKGFPAFPAHLRMMLVSRAHIQYASARMPLKPSGPQPLTLKVSRFSRGIILRWMRKNEIILWMTIYNNNNSIYLLSTDCVSGTIIRAFHVLSHLFLSITT